MKRLPAISKDYRGKKIFAVQWCNYISLGSEPDEGHDPYDCISTVFSPKKDTDGEPIPDMGYEYDILIYTKKDGKEHAEAFSALIGDPIAYVNNLADAGFGGAIIAKDKSDKTKKFADFVKKVLKDCEFSKQTIANAVLMIDSARSM